MKVIGLWSWCLTPRSIIFQLNRGGHNVGGKVIEETEAITGLSTTLVVVNNDGGTCDVALDSKENAVKLLHGAEINDVEYNVSFIFSDKTVVSFMKLSSYFEYQDIIS